MRDRGASVWAGLASIALIACFIILCLFLAQQRLEINEYPEGSSLRTDPAGTSVLFNSLARTGIKVTRQYELDQIPTLAPEQTTLFFVAPRDSFNPDAAANLLRFVALGGRLVVASSLNDDFWAQILRASQQRKKADEQKKKKSLLPPQPLDFWKAVAVERHGGGYANCTAIRQQAGGGPDVVPPPAVDPFPVSSRTYLVLKDGAWARLYVCGDKVIMAARKYGLGSIVVASDSAFLTNQRLSERLDAALLLWLVGGRPQVVADEALHGLSSYHGFVWLMQRYHLGTAILAFLGLFLLNIWRVAPSLLPREQRRSDSGARPAVVALENERDGYVRLLRRAIPQTQMLSACAQEWQHDNGRSDHASISVPGESKTEAELVSNFNQMGQSIAASADDVAHGSHQQISTRVTHV